MLISWLPQYQMNKATNKILYLEGTLFSHFPSLVACFSIWGILRYYLEMRVMDAGRNTRDLHSAGHPSLAWGTFYSDVGVIFMEVEWGLRDTWQLQDGLGTKVPKSCLFCCFTVKLFPWVWRLLSIWCPSQCIISQVRGQWDGLQQLGDFLFVFNVFSFWV